MVKSGGNLGTFSLLGLVSRCDEKLEGLLTNEYILHANPTSARDSVTEGRVITSSRASLGGFRHDAFSVDEHFVVGGL